MNTEALLPLVFNILLVFPLYYASKEDMKYHRIDKKYVQWILGTVLIYVFILYFLRLNIYPVERTFSFVITLGLFSGITFFSKGGFGFGDTLILAALGWYIGSTLHLSYFFIILVVVMIFWGIYQILTTEKINGEEKGIQKYFKMTKMMPIDQIKPGMILAKDYFMKGMNEQEIQDLKDKGQVYLDIKQAYPFIPVIFISFLIHICIGIYF